MEHITEKSIKISEFFLNNKELLQKLFLFTLFFVDVLIISGFALRFIVYNKSTIQQIRIEQSLTADYIPFADLRQRLAPDNLIIKQVRAISLGDNTWDLVAEVENPNEQWLVEGLGFRFVLAEERQLKQTDFILPQEKKYLMKFNIKNFQSKPNVRFEIVDVDWRRVRDLEPLAIVDQLKVSAPSFSNATAGGFRVFSTLSNNSAYNFWVLGLATIASNGTEIVAVNFSTLEQVRSGNQKPFEVAWSSSITRPNHVKVLPVINVFDESVYMPISTLNEPGDPSGVEFDER
jgi:hypothetical protein